MIIQKIKKIAKQTRIFLFYLFLHPRKFYDALSDQTKKWTLRGLVIFLIVLFAVPISIWYGSKKTQAAWWNDSWMYRKSIAVTNNTTAQSNVYISLTLDTSDTTKFQADCGDLRFTNLSGDLMQYYVVSGCGTVSTVVHTLFDAFPAGAQTIYYYYGNASAADGFSASDFATPASSYTVGSLGSEEKGTGPTAYWSFDEGQGTNVQDSTSNNLDGTISGATWKNESDCVGGRCLGFAGDDKLSVNDSSILDNTGPASISIWVKPTVIGGNISVINRSNFANLSDGFSLEIQDGKPTVIINGGRIAGTVQKCDQLINVNEFTHLEWTRDGSNNNKIFINGKECTYSATISVVQASASTTLGIGSKLSKNNIAPYANYSNRTYNSPYTASSWGGDAATITYYSNGGFNNLPYKILDKTAGGTGGSYLDDNGSITIENNKTYIVSAWIKANQTVNNISAHILNINRTADNAYRTGGTYNLTTSWQRFFWVYSAGADHAGSYKSRHIIYDDTGLPLDIYWTGFTVEDVTGTSQAVPNSDFTGTIDEVKIYNYARSVAQIKMDYNVGLAGTGGAEGASVSMGGKSQKWMTDGLVGHWKMDEASGNCIDSSGNNITGTANGTTVASGKFGNGRQFNGTSDNVAINYTNPVTQTSVVGWFKRTGAPAGGYHIITGGPNIEISIPDPGGQIRTGVTTATMGRQVFNSGSGLTDGNWHQLAMTYDGSNLKSFIDGVQTASNPVSGNLSGTAGEIGRYLSNSYVANGIIDEVRIYNRALSPSEITDLYNYAPGPVAYWNFEEGNGGSANDTSGNGKVGTLTNMDNVADWVPGKFGSALDFDGSNDYVSIPDSSANLSGNFSLSLWVKPRDNANNPRWFSLIDGANNLQVGHMGSGENVYFRIGGSTINTTSGISLDQWHNVQFIMNSGTRSIYIDGIQQATTSGGISADGQYSAIGGGYASYTGDGIIDDVKIYNYARTPAQIMADYGTDQAQKQPIGYWKFDEGYEGTAHNSGNGGGALDGTLSGTTLPTWNNGGKFGKTLSFSNGYVATPATTLNNTFSFSTWFNPSTFVAWAAVLTNLKHGAPASGLNIIPQSGSIRICYGDGTNAYTYYDVSTAEVVTGQWNHATVTYDGASAKLYLNGVLKDSRAVTIAQSSQAIRTGIWASSYTGYLFNGLIDEVKVYNHALTSDEVASDYNQGKSISLGSVGTTATGTPSNSADRAYCPPGDTTATCAPTAEWKFDEGANTTAQDTSGNGRFGTLTNMDATTDWIAGKIGKALDLDGSNDYVSLTRFAHSSTGVTLGGWIKTTSTDSTKSYTGNAAQNVIGDTTGGVGLGFGITGGKIQYMHYNGSWVGLTGVTDVNDGKWHYISVTHSSSGVVALYLDGKLDNSGTITFAGARGIDCIGRGYSADYFTGQLDDIKVYNYVRTPAQIAWEFNRGAPVGWWKMDEGEGVTAHDSSGNNNSGTLTNMDGATDWVDGKINKALDFDGGNDYVNLGTKVSTDALQMGNGAVTVSNWVKLTAASNYYSIFFGGATGGSNGYGTAFQSGSTNLRYETYGSLGGRQVYVVNGGITLNNWYHVVAIFDGINNKMKLYVNGVEKHNVNISDPGTVTFSGNFAIGSYSGTAWYFPGQIDDVRVYNYALNQDQIEQVYSGGAVNFK